MVKIFDFIGIGFGPANIALAIQLEERKLNHSLNYLFIESNNDSMWQREMLISGSDIQNIPIRDLITPINPQSYYSFLNYLHKSGRFFKYCGIGMKYPLRQEFSMYINWCAAHFQESVHYNETVRHIGISDTGDYYILHTEYAIYYSKMIVIATGRSLYIPPIFKSIPSSALLTINDFVSKSNRFSREKKYKFAVIGASQSAAEIFLELATKFYNSAIHSYIRKFSFVLRDSSPFSYEVFTPEFIDEYYHATDATKLLLNEHLRRTNYASVDLEVLDKINLKMYEEILENSSRLQIKRNSELEEIFYEDDMVYIKSINTVNNQQELNKYNFVVVCTGYKDLGVGEKHEYLPPLLAHFADRLILRNNKDVAQYISRNYEVFFTGSKYPVYLSGLCDTSHGMGDAGAFGLISVRASRILNALVNNLRLGE